MSQCRRHVPSFRASTSRRTSQGRAMPHGHVRFPNPWFQAYSGQILDQIPQPQPSPLHQIPQPQPSPLPPPPRVFISGSRRYVVCIFDCRYLIVFADRPDMGVSVQTLCLHSTLRRNGLRQH